ncbi:hypothetical protein PoB_004125500 [Plakobranchus ocellatus]|uniref:Uncharacterized protein n=1 Tax=Plakobranchus ocellatus TaxID=259542 RepID=A0AAV4B553_9GAST|nr:hypothetical protein PoB_004125500 [Plakobranchus ocellatus]
MTPTMPLQRTQYWKTCSRRCPAWKPDTPPKWLSGMSNDSRCVCSLTWPLLTSYCVGDVSTNSSIKEDNSRIIFSPAKA